MGNDKHKHLTKQLAKLRQRRESFDHPKAKRSEGKPSTRRPGSMNRRKQA